MRIRDTQDRVAWHEFVDVYAPLLHSYARRRGLQDADAADVAQQVLQSVALAIPGFQYDQSKGSFRGWLFTVARNHVFKVLQNHRRLPTATGDTSFHQALAQQPDESQDQAAWNQEHERRLFEWAAEKAKIDFKESTWNAFWQVAVEGQPAGEVAERLGMSVGAVYIAKSRVTACLRQLIETVEQC